MQNPANERKCLHLVVKSSAETLERCRSQFDDGDSVLFLDDGVMLIPDFPVASFQLPEKACLFSVADLDARGLAEFARDVGAQVVDDQQAVALLFSHDFCLTWK